MIMVRFGDKILRGVNQLADNVAQPRPRGRNVILQEPGGNPVITKDGVTVAEFVNFEDPFENAGAAVIKQAAAGLTRWQAMAPRPPQF